MLRTLVLARRWSTLCSVRRMERSQLGRNECQSNSGENGCARCLYLYVDTKQRLFPLRTPIGLIQENACRSVQPKCTEGLLVPLSVVSSNNEDAKRPKKPPIRLVLPMICSKAARDTRSASSRNGGVQHMEAVRKKVFLE